MKKKEIKNKSTSKENKLYIDYKTRLLISVLLVVFLSILSLLITNTLLNLSNFNKIKYNEKSNIDYKVYLKENNFYEKDYLEKDKVYIASLIDKILIDFKYDFDIETESNVKFNYEVIAKLSINDEVTGSNYYEKEYKIIDKKEESISNKKLFNLVKQVDINYSYYNSLANTFKQQYGVDTISNLNVYMKIYKGENESNLSTMYVKIPLSEKSVNIELDYQNISNLNFFLKTDINYLLQIVLIIFLITSLLLNIISIIKFVRLLVLMKDKKTSYDKYINRILNEYDRLIVESTTEPDIKHSNIIKLPNFRELLDVRDNLKLPIMYYVVVKHHKSYFYIKNNNDIYLLINKAADLEN